MLYLRRLLLHLLLLHLLLLLFGCFAYFPMVHCSSGEWLLASVRATQAASGFDGHRVTAERGSRPRACDFARGRPAAGPCVASPF